jgi:hypothetical protein
MNRIIDRSQALNTIGDDDASKAHLKVDIPRLKCRAALLNSAIFEADRRRQRLRRMSAMPPIASEFPWRCNAVSGGLRRQRQRSFGTSRGNRSPEAQRWHAGAEGSLAQISGVCLSCIRYRVTAKSTRRIAMTIQILMRDIMGMKPRCEWNSPTGVREFCWRRVSSLGQGAGVSRYPPGAC